MAERKQIAVWVKAESAALIDALRKETGQSTGRIIELAISAYSTSDRTSADTSKTTSADTSKTTSADTSGILEWREEVNGRLLALESRFEALRPVETIEQRATEKKAHSADLVASVACAATVEAGAETGVVEQGAVNKSLEDWESAVVAMYKTGTKNYQHIADQTYVAGFQNANGKKRDRSFVKKVLDKVRSVG